MDSTAIARREAEVIDAIRDLGLLVFGPQEISRFLAITPRNTYRILGRMVDKGLVHRLAQGTYILAETYDERDSYEIASALEPASYLGFWSALHFHGMTEQVPRTVFVAVTKQKRPLRVQGQPVKFVRIEPGSFFGYRQYGDVVASDPEKTLLDGLRLQEHAGGVEHVYRAIPDDIDVDRLIRYTERLGSSAVAARVGYLLERTGLLDGGDRLRDLVTSYTTLDRSGVRTNPVSRWKLYANVDLDD